MAKLRTNYKDGEELLAYDVNLITETINGLSDKAVETTTDIDEINSEITNIHADIDGVNDRIDDSLILINVIGSDLINTKEDVTTLRSSLDQAVEDLSKDINDTKDELEEHIDLVDSSLTDKINQTNQGLSDLASQKQDKLTAGANITITRNVISSNQIDDTRKSSDTTWSSSKIVQYITDAGFDVQIVSILPPRGEAHTIYFLPASDTEETNYYDEFMWIDNTWEKVGSTAIDLSNYYTRDEAATTAEINALFA